MRFGKQIVKPWMGIFGLFGFMGFIGAVFQPVFFSFFCFFAFFAFYWEGKLATEEPDERLIENQQKASRKAYETGCTLAFASMIMIGNIWGSTDPAKAYAALVIAISLAFALSNILNYYLAYKYDKAGGGDE